MINNHYLYIIVATDLNNGIGKNGTMPWHLPKELAYFQKKTTETKNPEKQNLVIMGRKTWESIPEKHRPFSNRKNVILTRQTDYKAKGATVVQSLEKAFEQADDSVESIFICGGGKVYADLINHTNLDGIFITKINKNFDCDTFFPEIPNQFTQKNLLGKDEDRGVKFQYQLLNQKN